MKKIAIFYSFKTNMYVFCSIILCISLFLVQSIQVVAAWPVPVLDMPIEPKLQPSVITSNGRRYLLDHYQIKDQVSVNFNEEDSTLSVYPEGWTLINYPIEEIQGLPELSINEISQLITGYEYNEVKNYYLFSEGNTPESDWRHKTGTYAINPSPEIVVDNTNPAASDTNPGSYALPLQTIQAAYDRASAGDTIQVYAGTYIENLTLDTDGTLANPIVLEGVLDSQDNQPIIRTTEWDGILITGAYNTLRNFQLEDTNSGLQAGIVRVNSRPGKSGQLIEFNNFIDPDGRGLNLDSQVGFFGTPVIARGNVISGAGVQGIGMYGTPDLLTQQNFQSAPGYAKGILEYNFIKNSNTIPVDRGWEAGVAKILFTAGSIIRYNDAEDNYGFGWWYDFMNYNSIMDGNYVKGSSGSGLVVGEASPGPLAAVNNIVTETQSDFFPFESGISAWDSTQMYAYNNTVDGRGDEDIHAYNLHRGNGYRSNPWQEDDSDPYDIGWQAHYANNVAYDNGKGANPSATPAITDVANYTDSGPGFEVIDLSNSFNNTAAYDYRLVQNSNLNTLGNANEGVLFSNKDFNGLLRTIPSDPFSVGAHRAYVEMCQSGFMIEVETINQDVSRLCSLGLSEPQDITLSMYAYLSGAYDQSGFMNSGLSSASLLPSTQPYTSKGYFGNEFIGVNSLLLSQVVDWVLVELLDTNGQVIHQKSGLVLTDGLVINSNGGPYTGITFAGVDTSNENYVKISHRNHIAIETQNTVAIEQGGIIDFRLNENVKNSNQLNLGFSRFGLRLGNSTGDTSIDSADRNALRNAQESSGVYAIEDINLDGAIDAIDRNLMRLQQEAVE